MLTQNGGWEGQELKDSHYLAATPYRWTQLSIDKLSGELEGITDTIISSISRDLLSGSTTS
jgi:hypothetical protein